MVGKVLEVLVPDKKARGFVLILAALGIVAGGGAVGYTLLVRNDIARIDHRVRPIKTKVYEDAAINRHIFEHLEGTMPAAQRHSIDDVRREGRQEMLDDEKVEKAAGAEE